MSDFILRKNQRMKKVIPVRYQNDVMMSEGLLTDLSFNGGAISGRAPVTVGMTFALQVFGPGDSEPLLIDHATVKWVKGCDFGVDIDTSERNTKERLQTIMVRLLKELQWRLAG
jgi:PilZ domain